jgi:acyl carrier protein
MNIEKQLKEVFKKTFKIDEEDFNTNLEINSIVNWDSMGHVRLFLEIEKKFNLKIESEDIESALNFKSILKILKIYLDEKRK